MAFHTCVFMGRWLLVWCLVMFCLACGSPDGGRKGPSTTPTSNRSRTPRSRDEHDGQRWVFHVVHGFLREHRMADGAWRIEYPEDNATASASTSCQPTGASGALDAVEGATHNLPDGVSGAPATAEGATNNTELPASSQEQLPALRAVQTHLWEVMRELTAHLTEGVELSEAAQAHWRDATTQLQGMLGAGSNPADLQTQLGDWLLGQALDPEVVTYGFTWTMRSATCSSPVGTAQWVLDMVTGDLPAKPSRPQRDAGGDQQ
ncbi:unnamed protein product [Symbiodinium natans]|uniref:Uncharacterized protein n=1 Tax=Symbiodinium natans TaxID=878477 RepID=A0A812UX00_9DINO|nr:unnamed protein product [Symbiodinium natans]